VFLSEPMDVVNRGQICAGADRPTGPLCLIFSLIPSPTSGPRFVLVQLVPVEGPAPVRSSFRPYWISFEVGCAKTPLSLRPFTAPCELDS